MNCLSEVAFPRISILYSWPHARLRELVRTVTDPLLVGFFLLKACE